MAMENEDEDVFSSKSVFDVYRRLPIFSLRKMSLLRILTTLCNHQQFLGLILKCKFQEHYDDKLIIKREPEWQAVQEMANKLVSQVCNCEKIKELIIQFLWPVCYKIMLWRFTYAPSIENQFLRHFYWTDQGRIDHRKTARNLIGNRDISKRKLFVLACSVCLREEIQKIWSEMSMYDRLYFRGENREKIRPLLLFWVHAMEGTDDGSKRFKNGSCTCAFDNELIDALKYIFAISTEEERKDLAPVYMGRFYNKIQSTGYVEADELDIGYFLFSELRVRDRQIFSRLSIVELTFLLHFADRERFFNELDRRLQSPKYSPAIFIFNLTFSNFHSELLLDDDYPKIFVYVWRALNDELKKKIADSYTGANYFSFLIRDNFPFILEKDSSKKISDLTSLDSSSETFGFHREKWEFLHFLIKEGMVTIPNLVLYRREVEDDLKVTKSHRTVWNTLLKFVRKVGSKT